jgi:uncharacterized Zn-binding protein involved in type VI secretion
MRGIARLGDCTHGVCYKHNTPLTVSGRILSASTDTFCDNLGVARLGDLVIADCGHTGTIISASPDALCNDLGVARLGDNIAGDYQATIISASTTAFVGTLYSVLQSGGVYIPQTDSGSNPEIIIGDYITLEDGVTILLSESLEPLLV